VLSSVQICRTPDDKVQKKFLKTMIGPNPATIQLLLKHFEYELEHDGIWWTHLPSYVQDNVEVLLRSSVKVSPCFKG